MVIGSALRNAAAHLKSVSDTPMLDARILMEKACSCDRLSLIKNSARELTEDIESRFFAMVADRASSRPIAYITHSKEFMGLDFYVDENVLIPRPDTEILAEFAIGTKKDRVLDIGTGSGALSVSIAKYLPSSHVSAVDISTEALKIAKRNAEKNSVSVSFSHLDILSEDIPDKYDLIVSNPPYIRNDVIPTLDSAVKNFEPLLALSGGDDGLIFYREITKKASLALNEKGILAFEIGFDQADDVCEIMHPFFNGVTVVKDLAGCNRVVWGVLS